MQIDPVRRLLNDLEAAGGDEGKLSTWADKGADALIEALHEDAAAERALENMRRDEGDLGEDEGLYFQDLDEGIRQAAKKEVKENGNP